MSDYTEENSNQQSSENFSPTDEDISTEVYEDEGDDDFINPTPIQLHEKYQEFLKAKGSKNTSQDLDADEIGDSNLNTSFGSESASPSFGDNKLEELVHCNKTLRQRNDELQEKSKILIHQLESVEDQNEQYKKEINTIEKELKCCHDMLRDRDNLENELENVQKELLDVCESKVKLEGHMKRLKSDKDELITTINNQQEQVERLSDDLRFQVVNSKTLYDENISLKDRCESLKLDIEVKDRDLEEKMQLYQEIREEVENFKGANQNLLEEKTSLVMRLREVQLEVSCYQTSHRASEEMHLSSVPNTPRQLFSLQSEIAEAEQENQRNSFRCSSPLSYSNSANDHPGFANGTVTFSDVSTHSNKKIFQDSFNQTEECIGLEQSPGLQALKEQCRDLQDNLQSKEKHVFELSEALNQHKIKGQYLARQLGMNLSKTRELLLQNQKQVDDIRQLSEINSRLCLGKLSTWLDANEPTNPGPSGEDGGAGEGNNEGQALHTVDVHSSRLVNALALEGYSAYELTKQDRSIGLSTGIKMANVENLVSKVKYLLKHDMASSNARLHVLNKSAYIMEEAITKKIDVIRSLLRDTLQWQQFGFSDDEKQLQCIPLTLSQDVKGYLQSAHFLMRQLGKYSKPIGALEVEKRYNVVFETLVHHIDNLNTKSYKLERKLNSKRNSDRFWVEDQAKMCSYNSPSVSDDSRIVEITPNLLRTITAPQPKWIQTLSRNRHFGGLFEAFMGMSYKVHTSFPSLSRTSYLLLTLVLCCYFTFSWVDYKVDPVF